VSQDDLEFLKVLAKRYIWWKRPADAASEPRRVIAQVMNLGDWDDVRMMQQRLGDAALRDALTHAEAGQFNARSWTWWHYSLGLASVGQVPPLPVRRFA
jgi:hypothetical protein